MPFLFRHERRWSVNNAEIRKYSWYAIGEVVLIFFGITLALWFENWNEQRQLESVEVAALEDVLTNLQANLESFERSIAFDRSSIASCDEVIKNLEARAGWSDLLGQHASRCRWWTSPYLQSAAYESLKSQGTQLISNRELRGQVVALYENTYNYLINDTDRSFWGFQDSVMEPVYNNYMRRSNTEIFEPVSYDALAESSEFLNMLYMKKSNQNESIRDQLEASDATYAVISAIELELGLIRESQ